MVEMSGNKRVVTKEKDARQIQKAALREIGIHGMVLTLTGLFILLSIASFDVHDLDLPAGNEQIGNWMGVFGVKLAAMFFTLFGALSWVLAGGMMYVGVKAIIRRPPLFGIVNAVAPAVALISSAILINLATGKNLMANEFKWGGLIGEIGQLLYPLLNTGTVIVAAMALVLSIMYLSGFTLRAALRALGRGISSLAGSIRIRISNSFRNRAELRRQRRELAARDRPEPGEHISEILPADLTPLPPTIDVRPAGRRNADVGQDEPGWAAAPDGVPDPSPIEDGSSDTRVDQKARCDDESGRDDSPPVIVTRRSGRQVSDKDEPTGAVNTTPESEPDEGESDDIVPGGGDQIGDSAPKIVVNRRNKANIHEDQMLPGVVKGPWEPPPLSLLDYREPEHQTLDREWLNRNAERLENKLLDYKVQGKVREIHPGPVVTMYEFLPAAGVKISQIANLADDLTMALEAVSIRIVAPIPGRGVVGIEVPNKIRETVYLREILASEEFTKSRSKLTIALGKDIFGNPVVTDLGRMPHLLIAGATGSGKSVAVNAFILSLLRNASPEEVRIILVDPKVVELQVYEDIPHLLLPVVYDPKHAAAALRWAVDEMERRYSLLARVSARNISTFNQRVEKIARVKAGVGSFDSEDEFDNGFAPNPDDFEDEDLVKLPNIVIVLDEFADLMMVASKDVETAVARLAQKARAAGIHLIMATQRPSKEVITGLIKANFPARMAFRVSSAIDSRIILDQRGGESLLGYGDMLFLKPGTASLERVHGSFVSDDEVVRFVAHLKTQGTPDYRMEIIQTTDDEGAPDESEEDELTEEAIQIVRESGRASISYVQRRLKIGYNRAARIMETLEKRGIVGPPDRRGERQILN